MSDKIPNTPQFIQGFSQQVLHWYHQHGRKDLPWQQNPTPYRVWVSEIMLQQTQVNTVIPYYQRFISTFPNVDKLANAPLDEVLSLWTGLGYYARARNLHKAAIMLKDCYQSTLPQNVDELTQLPGIGRSTAGAIASLAMNKKAAILDGNVKRVLARSHCIEGWPGHTQTQKQLWHFAEQYTPDTETREYNQAMMDLGATVCVRSKPHCTSCPLETDCQANMTGQQQAFPQAKPRKIRPEKALAMLMIINENGEILLHKRPPTGIWGGLWSLPECEIDHSPKQYCENHLQIQATQLNQWDTFHHDFSHYRLQITPVKIMAQTSTQGIITKAGGIAEANDLNWFRQSETQKLGMASPVQKLLQRLNAPT